MKRSVYLFLILGLLFTLQSCQKDDGPEAPQNLVAPSIPPISLVTIPTQTFEFAGSNNTISTRNDKSNWVHAGVNVLVWNTVVFANTAIPITAFSHAFDYEAEYIGDLTWEWTYDYQSPPDHGSTKYEVSLTGQYISNNDEVAWTMTVTEKGTSNSFVWYEGIVSRTNTTGMFTINKDPQNPQPYMSIEFSKKVASNDVTIRFSNVLANDPGQGDYIEWRTENANELDRIYHVFTKDNLLEIEANDANRNGRVKDPAHFEDSDWHCWNTAKVNIDC